MEGNRPKRRKDKYNPYTICENNGHYYISPESVKFMIFNNQSM